MQGRGTRGLAYHEGGRVLKRCNRVGVDVSAKELVVAIVAVDREVDLKALAKAAGGPAIAADSIDHLYRYIELLFRNPSAKEMTP